MHSTKTEILALLKRTDGATVDEIASSLGLAPMTVRQHLTALERDCLVRAEEVRRPTGRPHYRYRLTDDGHRHVATGTTACWRCSSKQAGLLEPADLAGATPDERRAQPVPAAARCARRAAPRRSARAEPEPRASTGSSSILRAHGGFAEWHEDR